jgi:hypothetical protein
VSYEAEVDYEDFLDFSYLNDFEKDEDNDWDGDD